MKRAIIINLFGGPGAGKSTGAAYIFAELKLHGVRCELVTEFAKDLVWEQTKAAFDNQSYIFGQQGYRISRCASQVDVVITDSPLLLSIFYNQDPTLTENFDKTVLDVFNSYTNRNYILERKKKYDPVGRFQTYEEALDVDQGIEDKLDALGIPYARVSGDRQGYEQIVADILNEQSWDEV